MNSLKTQISGGAWVAQSVMSRTFDFSSGPDRVLSICLRFSLPLFSAHPPQTKQNKKNKTIQISHQSVKQKTNYNRK